MSATEQTAPPKRILIYSLLCGVLAMKSWQKVSPATFSERLNGEAQRVKQRLKEDLPQHERVALSRKLGQIETAAQVDRWIRSAGLQRPKRASLKANRSHRTATIQRVSGYGSREH
jgi:hypothetical protein